MMRTAELVCVLLALASVPATAQEGAERPASAVPFDFPAVATAAEAGHYVLCPSRAFIDAAFDEGVERQTFIYYTATMVQPGSEASEVRTLAGTQSEIPNSMMIPVRRGETAEPGDIVLTWWQSGSGMQRAMIVEGGSPAEPRAMYLDIDWDNPSGAAQRVDTLRPDSFHRLTTPGEPGTSLICQAGGKALHVRATQVAGSKLLGLRFGGKMAVYPAADCTSVPIRPKVAAGDRVRIPAFGSFRNATVDRVDEATGRVFVSFEFGGKSRTEAIAFGDVAPAQ